MSSTPLSFVEIPLPFVEKHKVVRKEWDVVLFRADLQVCEIHATLSPLLLTSNLELMLSALGPDAAYICPFIFFHIHRVM